MVRDEFFMRRAIALARLGEGWTNPNPLVGAVIVRDGKIIACGSVEELARTNARRVTLRGSAEVQVLSGIRDCQQTEEGLSFLYSGEQQALLQTLARGEIRDLTIAEPDLEEIFLHYYEKEAEGK